MARRALRQALGEAIQLISSSLKALPKDGLEGDGLRWPFKLIQHPQSSISSYSPIPASVSRDRALDNFSHARIFSTLSLVKSPAAT